MVSDQNKMIRGETVDIILQYQSDKAWSDESEEVKGPRKIVVSKVNLSPVASEDNFHKQPSLNLL